MENLLLWLLAALLIGAGLVGLVLPLLPGVVLLFAGLWLGAWIDNYAYVGAGTLLALGIMAALTFVCDAAGTAFGAKRYGASRRAIIGAAIGSVVGLFFALPGILLGPFIGAVVGELSVRPDARAATRAGFGAAVGLALAVAAKLALGFAMIGIFLFMRLI
ncbi:MAG: DUF456 domain-containing protein [Sulfurifustis sp.]